VNDWLIIKIGSKYFEAVFRIGGLFACNAYVIILACIERSFSWVMTVKITTTYHFLFVYKQVSANMAFIYIFEASLQYFKTF